MQSDFPKHLPIPACSDNEYREVAWGIEKLGEKYKPFWINRPKVGDHDVKVDLLYCGICHSDVILGTNDLGNSIFPMVPGHEIVGTVLQVGSKVTKCKVGDNVGIGLIKDSCLDCGTCKNGDEQYCECGGSVFNFNSMKKFTHIGGNPATQNFGGFAATEVMHEHFILNLPASLPLEAAGPIMCGGITVYDPLRHWGATSGKKMNIGIVGIGGLGTMGIKLSAALGHNVTAISTSDKKEKMAKEKGATTFVVSKNPEQMKAAAQSLDLILNTVSAPHQASQLIPLLKPNGTLVQIGLVKEPHMISNMALIPQRKNIAGSMIGGIAATQELLELCAKHNITPDVQQIEANQIDWACEQLLGENKDGIRYVVDIKKSLNNGSFLPKKE